MRQSYQEKFNDRLASLISWAPASHGSSSEAEAVLQRNPDGTLSYAVDVGEVLKSALAFLFGAALIYAYLYSDTRFGRVIDSVFDTSWYELLLGVLISTFAIFNLWRICRPEVFDKRAGWYWHGWKQPTRARKVRIGKRAIRLELIHAIQLLSKEVTRDDKIHVVHELNLVLNDCSRLNLSCCGDRALLLKEATQISKYLEVPVWNALDDIYRIES